MWCIARDKHLELVRDALASSERVEKLGVKKLGVNKLGVKKLGVKKVKCVFGSFFFLTRKT